MPLRRWMTSTVLIGLALALAGCGTSGTGTTSRTVQPPLATMSPTAQSTATAMTDNSSPTVVANAQPCNPPNAVRIGDIAVSKPTVLYGFNADYMLPDSVSTAKPVTVTVQNNTPYISGAPLESAAVVQPVSFLIGVCNMSATITHRLTNLGVILASLTPYSGQLNALNGCASLYARSGNIGGECASGYSPDLEATLLFPANAAAQAKVTLALAQPANLAPGRGIDVSIGVTPPTSTAIMTFQFGLGVDGQAITYPTGMTTQPAINAPIAHRWAGDYCNTAQMQSQIPATSPANTYYVCPKV